MTILAHKDGDRIQTLTEHSYNVANLARDEASTINQGHVLFLLGLYHDLGKADRKFQEKLTDNFFIAPFTGTRIEIRSSIFCLARR